MNLASPIPARRVPLALAAALMLAVALALPSPCAAQGREIAPEAPPAENVEPIDAFLAGALGLTPFVSGLYLSERPMRGILFTAVDLLAAMGVYTSHYSPQGRPDYVRGYFLVMTGNNLLDAFVSTRYARTTAVPRALLLPSPEGGWAGALRWTF